MGEIPPRPLYFMGGSKNDLREMPDRVQDDFGQALRGAQFGQWPAGARPFGEGLPRAVLKLVEDFDRDTYRAAYTVAFPECVYVLHVFKKKSKSGVGTSRPDLDLIRARLKAAELHHKRTYER